MRKITNHLLWFCFIPLLLNAQQKNDNTILSLVKTQLGNEFTIEETNALQLSVNSFHKSKQSGLEHYYFKQLKNGLEIIGTESSLHVKPDGSVFRFNNRLIKGAAVASKTSVHPTLNAIEAVQTAGKHLWYTNTGNLKVLEHSARTDRYQKISKGTLSRRDIPVKLVYHISSTSDLVLAWDLSIYETRNEEWWSLNLDAKTGKILSKDSWTTNCKFDTGYGAHDCTKHPNNPTDSNTPDTANNVEEKTSNIGSYRVFDLPLAHPGEGGRTTVEAPSHPVASPFGWHDTDGAVGPEFTTTRGNNVHAFDAGNNNGYSPDGGSGLFFSFPLDLSQDPDLFEDAGITNLFYWNNIAHDVLYQYGFDEASGNFQENNYNNGGAASDFVNARSQASAGCNAFFSTPPDGANPQMTMLVCNGRDGDYANAVILHEYGHGLSIRLTGGPGTSSCLFNAEQMGEGWSDYLGVLFTIKQGDTGPDSRAIGDWLFNNPAGIRPYPYSTDLSVNPHTYANSFSGTSQPHGIGAVWCAMIWEMTWGLIDQYGFDSNLYSGTGGNNIALQLVVEGLKLQPCNPGFVDGRDAILAADQALYNGANQCIIWNAFAKRGLGLSADQGSSFDRTDGTEAFDLPAPCDLSCPQDLTLTGTETGTITHEAAETINSTQTIASSANVIYTAGNSITLNQGFFAQPNSVFLAEIAMCSNFNKTNNNNQAPLPNEFSYSFYTEQNSLSSISDSEETAKLSSIPNPFQSSTTVSFNLDQDAEANLSVYDLNGRKIVQLANGRLLKGNHEFDWKPEGVPPGVYLARLIYGDIVLTARMVLTN